MKRRTTNVFSLSFIDCITCGLGAVILLFVIVNARSEAHRNDVTRDLRSQAERLEQEVLDGKKNLVIARNTMEQTSKETTRTQGLSRRIIKTLQDKKIQIAEFENDTLSVNEHINRLKSDLKSLENDYKRLKAGSTARADEGTRLKHFKGEGDRQYLTDLKMGGTHIVILVDASASMLADTIVEIIRRRNMPVQQKLNSDKWLHAVSAIDWLTTQLPPSGKFQVYTFNETAAALMKSTGGAWLDTGNPRHLSGVIDRLRQVVPEGGTSLANAFAALRGLVPSPDNIFLLTDGLPTMGEGKPVRKNVSGEKRLKLYRSAIKLLPQGVPVNVILFPLEGDPAAPSAYWKLAADTRGSFFSPSRDWP